MLDLIRGFAAGVSLHGLIVVGLLTVVVVCVAGVVHRPKPVISMPAEDWEALIKRTTVHDIRDLTTPLPHGLRQGEVDDRMAAAAADARKGRRGYDALEAEQAARAAVQAHADRERRRVERYAAKAARKHPRRAAPVTVRVNLHNVR